MILIEQDLKKENYYLFYLLVFIITFFFFDSVNKHTHCQSVAINPCYILFCFSEEAEDLAKKLRLKFYRTSVKEDLNVNDGKWKWAKAVNLIDQQALGFHGNNRFQYWQCRYRVQEITEPFPIDIP